MTGPVQSTTVPANPPFAKGSLVWQRKGPLPVWAWVGLLLLLVLVVVWWRRDRQDSAQANNTGAGSSGTEPAPGNQIPPGVWVVPSAAPPPVNVTFTPPATRPYCPPAGGSPSPTLPPGGGTPPADTTPAGGSVKVTEWPDTTKPKESSLWDIAGTWLPEGAEQWGLIWNHPLNATLKAKRKEPKYIQAGDVFFVPNKLSSPRNF